MTSNVFDFSQAEHVLRQVVFLVFWAGSVNKWDTHLKTQNSMRRGVHKSISCFLMQSLRQHVPLILVAASGAEQVLERPKVMCTSVGPKDLSSQGGIASNNPSLPSKARLFG